MDKTNHTPPEAPLVLVVDDEPTMRYLMRRSLTMDGYRVEEAVDGLQALEVFEQTQPDLVLLDIMMPKLDGFAVCDRLRQLPGGEKAQVVMVTGVSDRHAIDQAFKAGAVDYITKPVHQRVLRQRVGFILRAKRAETCSQVDQDHYQRLFTDAPVALCEWDFSEVKRLLSRVQAKAGEELALYLYDRPEIISQCLVAAQLCEANQRALTLFQANEGASLPVSGEHLFPPESFSALSSFLAALAEEQTQGQVTLPIKTLTGQTVKVKLYWTLTRAEAGANGRTSLSMAMVNLEPAGVTLLIPNGRDHTAEIEIPIEA